LFQTKVLEKIETYFAFGKIFFKNRVVYEIKWENITQAVRPQKTILCTRIACWMPKDTHTLTVCNTYCFSTAAMVAGKSLNVKF